jgi:hypothetical protein
MQDLRRIVNTSGYGTRVSDRDLNVIVESTNPRQAAEDLVRRLGGRPGDFRNVIDQLVNAVQAENRSTQDAPAASGDVSVSEYADRLRTVAAGMGLPANAVEQALAQAGMIQTDEDETETDGSIEEIGTEIVRLMKKMLKKLDKIANSL